MDTCQDCKELKPRNPKELTKKTVKRHGCEERNLLRTGKEPACMLFKRRGVGD